MIPYQKFQHGMHPARKFSPHPPKPPVESNSRAGRNLPAATATAIILLGIIAASLVFYIQIFVVLATIALVIGIWEFSGAVLARNIRVPFITLSVSVIFMVLLTWEFGVGAGFLGYLISTTLALGITKYYLGESLRTGIVAVFGLAWIGLSGVFAIGMAHLPAPTQILTALILLPAANDTGGWCAGILFGKHPMVPKISPKKSWEGFGGSMFLSLLVSYLIVGLFTKLDWPWAILFGVITPFIATAGDFAESMIKRDLGIKDMGSVFPGHGGMLDRLDSILFCAPVFYFLFALAFGAI
ncbi:phosphatidate cytidylyltransferase [Arcanobacterium hippocoleae]|uniref:Phosphatidate cytidylyltransferase n=1 Tax=Arcanobacterium hippocoleae TaxID=149017 RepID=A0ABU1T142_9ACTO|nr:phosphatidate cytidylyltransferase [Arcanobacterium hippocoleae]MDR6939083.1 phosphatidate cytidylyltransferase [Arcanobacterium hippocoleae]